MGNVVSNKQPHLIRTGFLKQQDRSISHLNETDLTYLAIISNDDSDDKSSIKNGDLVDITRDTSVISSLESSDQLM